MEQGINYRQISGQLKGGKDQMKYALVNTWSIGQVIFWSKDPPIVIGLTCLGVLIPWGGGKQYNQQMFIFMIRYENLFVILS